MSESIQSTYLKKYTKVWDENLKLDTNFKDVLERGFAFQYDGLKESPDILFLGINPSFKEGSEEWRGSYSIVGLTNPGYFKSFERIQDRLESGYKTKTKVTHLDLCVFRETNQKFIKKVLFKSDNGLKFISDQIKISKEILEEIKPKIIVCSNTMAKHLLGRDRSENKKGKEEGVWLGYDFEFNKELGTDIITGNSEEGTKLDGTPIFFTSMLSGQRALDNGSKERLIWHINKALEWKK
ncbi:MAG: hypothetical protein QMC16_01120 [Flavobacteriales bacterium]|jgi:hypothetical protein